ncbi:MAG: von Willebrand factor type A domain-containing protein [Paracoccaceae bacterium]
MTDDLDTLDELKSAMHAATPAPDPARRAQDLALAQKNFADLQGSTSESRLTSERPKTGLRRGLGKMIDVLSSRAGLTATTALIAVTFVTLGPGSDLLQLPRPSLPGLTGSTPELAVAPKDVEMSAGEIADQLAKTESARNRGVTYLAEEEAPLAQAAPAPSAEIATTAQLRSVEPSALSRMQQPAAGLAAPSEDRIAVPEANTEAYANEDPNPVQVTAENPVSTFSIDVDTASYALARNSIQRGVLPHTDAVRIEEMINYFNYGYFAPDGDMPFSVSTGVMQTPWNPGTQLVHIGIQGELPAMANRPPLNLVFLIDTSGSMQDPDKLPLLKQSFTLMLSQLRPEDQVAIVTYAGSAGQVLEPTPASDRKTILAALNRLEAGGSTAGQAGLQQAYDVAQGMSEEGEVSRVILATDGDFNVGLSDPQALKDYIADKRETGTYLSVLGFGRGNLDDATMQALAQNGNGQAAYIDTLSEAQKVLVDQLSGALFAIAEDVKIQVEFNPATVAEYRLIGYETRALRREDFNNDKVDAGEIGAGTSVTAIYEVTPVGSDARLTDPLRYSAVATEGGSDELGFLRLRYKEPGESTSQLIEAPITADLPPMEGTGWAAAMAGFGQLLRDDSYLGDWGWDQAIALANANRGADPYGYRAEAVQVMRLAQSLAAR